MTSTTCSTPMLCVQRQGDKTTRYEKGYRVISPAKLQRIRSNIFRAATSPGLQSGLESTPKNSPEAGVRGVVGRLRRRGPRRRRQRVAAHRVVGCSTAGAAHVQVRRRQVPCPRMHPISIMMRQNALCELLRLAACVMRRCMQCVATARQLQQADGIAKPAGRSSRHGTATGQGSEVVQTAAGR